MENLVPLLPNPITGLPCDLSSLALLEIAIVPEGLINLSNFEISINLVPELFLINLFTKYVS